MGLVLVVGCALWASKGCTVAAAGCGEDQIEVDGRCVRVCNNAADCPPEETCQDGVCGATQGGASSGTAVSGASTSSSSMGSGASSASASMASSAAGSGGASSSASTSASGGAGSSSSSEPLDTFITAVPPLLTNQTSADFVLASNRATEFFCGLGQLSTRCSTQVHFDSVPEGSVTFMAAAIEAGGVIDATPASYTWTVDVTPPQTTIEAAPASPSPDALAPFEFESPDVDAEFECTLDALDPQPCEAKSAFPVAEGAHTLSVAAVDAAGNTDQTPATHAWVVDLTFPPSPGTATLLPASDTGSSNSDGITNAANPAVRATCTVGELLQFREGATVLASGICPAGGALSLSIGAVSEGEHRIVAAQVDAAGNLSPAPGELVLVIDRAAPAAPGAPLLPASEDTGASDSDGITNHTAPEMEVPCEDGATVTVRETTTTRGTAVCVGSLARVPLMTLSTGAHTLSAAQSDVAGNNSPTGSGVTITIDTTPPPSPDAPDLRSEYDTGPSTIDNVTSDPRPEFRIVGCFSGGLTSIKLSGAPAALGTALCVTGRVRVDAPLANGEYSFVATAQDVAGNESAPGPPLLVTIDDTVAPPAPGLPDLLAASDSGRSDSDNVTNGTYAAFSVPCSPSGVLVELFVNGQLAADNNCSSSQSAGFTSIRWSNYVSSAAPVMVQARVTQPSNSALSETLLVRWDQVVPAAPGRPDLEDADDSGISATDNLTSFDLFDISTNCEPDADVTLWSNSVIAATARCVASPVRVSLGPLLEGTYALAASQVDAAGNPSGQGASLSLVIDTTPPGTVQAPALSAASDTGTSNTDRLTSDATPTLMLNCHGGGELAILEDTTELARVVCSGSTATNLTTSTLTDGAHALAGRAIDAAGNLGPVGPPLGITVDTDPPPEPGKPDLVTGSDNGSSNTDNRTSVTSPSFSVACLAGHTVELRTETTSLVSGACPESGNVVLVSRSLGYAAYAVTASQTDVAGNSSAPGPALDVTITPTP